MGQEGMQLNNFTISKLVFVCIPLIFYYSFSLAQNKIDVDAALYFYNSVNKPFDTVIDRFGQPAGVDYVSGTKVIWYKQGYTIISFGIKNDSSFFGIYIYSPNDKILDGTDDNFVSVTLLQIFIQMIKKTDEFELLDTEVNGSDFIKKQIFYRHSDGIKLICDIYKNNLGNLSYQIIASKGSD